MKYAFIGGGNMGSAMAAALVQRGLCAAAEILVVDPDAARQAQHRAAGYAVAAVVDAAVGRVPVVVLAVKPQTAPDAFAQLKPLLGPGQTIVSIMAGITMAALSAGLGSERLVRVMPNTPAQVGLGMNVYMAAAGLDAAALTPVEQLLGACGEALRVESEDAIDAATAVSGSGPAYVFYVAEHWLKAAQELGFTAEQAARLVQQTLLGATTLWQQGGTPVGTLREQVTSKGGTTAAALGHFEAQAVGEHIRQGVHQAYRRAKELGS